MSEGAVSGDVSGAVSEGGAVAPPVAPQGASALLGEAAPPDAPATPAAPVEAAPETPTWANGYTQDDIAFFQSKGWDKAENPNAELVKGYRNLERLRGVKAEQLVRIPEPGNEEQVAEFRQRMGVPESVEGYESPEVQVAGQAIDTGVIAGLSHRIAATPEQHAELAQGVGEYLEAVHAEQNAALNARLSAEVVELKAEWGELYAENEIAAKKGFEALGWDEGIIDSIEASAGHKAVMKAAALVGRMTGEHRRGDDGEKAGGDVLAFGLTPEAAKSLVKTEGPELMRRSQAGDEAAKARLAELNKVAFHG